MELSEEEKKAIECIKQELIEPFYNFPNPTSIELKDTKVELLERVINLIEKQQKEIEKLKGKNTQLTNYLNDSYYVSADKIREIIAEYQKQLQSADTERTSIMLSNFIMVLNDLLEENKWQQKNTKKWLED